MKLNRFQLFFQAAYLKFTKYIFDKGEEDIKPLLEQQSKDMKNLLNEISNMMLIYKIHDSVMSMSESDQKKEKSILDKVIENTFKSQYRAEQKQIVSMLNEVGQDKYNSNSFLFTLDKNNKRKRLNTEELKKIISQKVEGKSYSERLWADKNQVASTLQNEIKKFMQGKTSVNDIQEVIEKRFKANENNTKRIVATEIARVQSAVGDKWCKDNGIEYQLFSVVLDNATSRFCKPHANDPPYKVNDVNKPIPPLHPFCRSTLIPITPEGYRPNIPRNEVGWEEYQQWEKDNIETILKESSKDKITKITEESINKVQKISINGLTKEQNDIIYNEHKELLRYAMNNNDSKEVSYVFSKGLYSKAAELGQKDMLEFKSSESINILSSSHDIFVMHNHPTNKSFSMSDLQFFITNENVKYISAAKNNGELEVLIKNDGYDSVNVRNQLFRLIKKNVKSGTDAEYDKVVKKFLEKSTDIIFMKG
ncbi:minor capsid protein [Clostridium beijerinckii]|nr:minor capsid protein [Clostridium beijerinckii]NRU41631.1 SPP1 gp7 family putative phage head morphogenesis protein [Clostridium beijerinckii]NSB00825.1 SPP1 gp7 family putative phage head morphogenesis protein [Clostridium beijerinckii]